MIKYEVHGFKPVGKPTKSKFGITKVSPPAAMIAVS